MYTTPPTQPSRRQRAMPHTAVTPDAGIASYFVWVRRQTGMSIHQTAAMIQTEAEVISALEAGAIGDLPAWPETARIVGAYAALAQVDADGPLSAIYARWPAATQATPTSTLRRTTAGRSPRVTPVTAQAVSEAKTNRVKTSLASRNRSRLSLRFW